MAICGRDLLELRWFLSGSDDATLVERMDSRSVTLRLVRLEALTVIKFVANLINVPTHGRGAALLPHDIVGHLFTWIADGCVFGYVHAFSSTAELRASLTAVCTG